MTTVEDRKDLIQEVLDAYPEKAQKRRSKHLNVAEEGASDCGVKSNKKSVPGVMTTRGCAYAGAKGVVWGPVKDMIHISHGPVGCGYYSWSGRRNYYIGTTGVDTFGTMQFTSDFQERDIVFGGDKKLAKLIDELEELFPLSKGTTIESECPVGLIGDDIEAVARQKAKETGKPVVPVRCEGFRGVSQSLGHHIANDTVRDWVLPKADDYRQLPEGFESTPYDVNIIGDYNIGGDAWPSRRLLEDMGLRVICQFSGDGTFNEVVMTPLAKLKSHPLLSVDELHLPLHGRKIWHWLARVQLLWSYTNCQVFAEDCCSSLTKLSRRKLKRSLPLIRRAWMSYCQVSSSSRR